MNDKNNNYIKCTDKRILKRGARQRVLADSVTHREKFYGIQGYEKLTKSFFFLLRIFKPCYTRPALILLQKVKNKRRMAYHVQWPGHSKG